MSSSLKYHLRLKKQLFSVSSFSFLFTSLTTKWFFSLILLLLLPYSFSTQALSAVTSNTIQGTPPYLTFDNGVTKATTTDGLLSITLSDPTTTPTTKTTITASGNTSTAANPYILPVAGQTFADIGMLVPTTVDTIGLNELIGAPYNYWGDDDGDGGISATGNLSVVITDKNAKTVNRSDVLTICNAPYKVGLTSTAGSLKTQYGDPNVSTFTAATAAYYISPPSAPTICFAKPDMTYATGNYAGPDYMWNTTKGFILQSTTYANYGSNFPTTGANGLYFDLDIGGSAALSWAPVTVNGITATMTPNASGTSVRITLTGPTTAIPPSAFATEGATFELEGKSGSTTMLKYGFKLNKWFVNNGSTKGSASTQDAYCKKIGYNQSKVSDLTNAKGTAGGGGGGTIQGATPSSTGNYYSRIIGTALFSEWGNMNNYTGSGFDTNYPYYWTSNTNGSYRFSALSNNGAVTSGTAKGDGGGVCVYP